MGVGGRLYYEDSYLTQFHANVLDAGQDGLRVYLDRTAFYPTSGGQLFDTGQLGEARVTDVIDEGGRIAHVVDRPIAPGPVQGTIDWPRRFDFMQQHSGQHLLSAVFAREARLSTLSVHLGSDSATIDLDAAELSPDLLARIEKVANDELTLNHDVSVTFEDAATAEGLRKASDREGLLRIVTIAELDRSACGGTHVRRTGEIGCILLRKVEKIRKAARIEFLCGGRAISAARAGFAALKAQGAAHQERIVAMERERRKMADSLAEYRAKTLYSECPPGADGLRRIVVRPASIDELVRVEAQTFVAEGHAIFLALAENAVLLAVSPDAGVSAGELIRRFAERGGGAAGLAQGTMADAGPLLAALGFPSG